ncbi:MAG TPA: DNA/RNA helicase domain-containing protein [Acetobacteraceae bacterium]|nr:DNA/RNA helicase domain-containing protein [Acetobacteraceae bacterium]
MSEITGALARGQIRHFRVSSAQQLRAWEATIAMLRPALAAIRVAATWHILLEYPMLRLGKRPDVILLTHSAILVLEIKAGSSTHTAADRRQVEDYAIDLYDFHGGSRGHPIVPILVAENAAYALPNMPLILNLGVLPPLDTSAAALPALLIEIVRYTDNITDRLDADAWLRAPYQPVPTIIDGACMLYAKHNVAEIRAARSDSYNLVLTTKSILKEIAWARTNAQRIILFVTGIPGAGKTLCGLNTIFGVEDTGRGTYLTGNPTLIHVLREALTRDAVDLGAQRGDARRKMLSVIQALPKFRDHYASYPVETPAESIVVVDEAQRCWSANWAIQKTRDKAVPLTRSEPAYLLEIMARRSGFCAVVCLVGSGQEIHAGEGGLAEWGNALRDADRHGVEWHVRAAPDLLDVADLRQRLGALDHLQSVPSLHLNVAIRHIRSTLAASWVDRVVEGDASGASELAREMGEVPFWLTRNLIAARKWLRGHARGLRRAGLLASSGGARLRSEGLGAELPHMDASSVAHWFLDRFPDDVRASDALEVVATEFSCQGLELDYVGLCWDADFIREPGRAEWRVRTFRGTKWQVPQQAEVIANQVNTYRVLLTRARYDTVIFVPNGNEDDRTRDPSVYNDIAAFLRACGTNDLDCSYLEHYPESDGRQGILAQKVLELPAR